MKNQLAIVNQEKKYKYLKECLNVLDNFNLQFYFPVVITLDDFREQVFAADKKAMSNLLDQTLSDFSIKLNNSNLRVYVQTINFNFYSKLTKIDQLVEMIKGELNEEFDSIDIENYLAHYKKYKLLLEAICKLNFLAENLKYDIIKYVNELSGTKQVPQVDKSVQAISPITPNPIPERFKCGLSFSAIMFDPVIIADGKQFVDRSALLAWLKYSSIDPFSRRKIDEKKLISATKLKKEIEDFLMENPNYVTEVIIPDCFIKNLKNIIKDGKYFTVLYLLNNNFVLCKTFGKILLESAIAESGFFIADFIFNKIQAILVKKNMTLLHLAALEGHYNFVEYLIKHGAQSDAKTSNGNTALHFLILSLNKRKFPKDGDFDKIFSLFSMPVFFTANSKGVTPVSIAIERDWAITNKLFLFFEKNISSIDFSTILPLNCLGMDSHKFLSKKLFCAIEGNNIILVKFYLLLSNNINLANQNEFTRWNIEFQKLNALSDACLFRRVEIVKLLLELGADPNACNEPKTTPLHLAALSGNIAILKLLLVCGAAIETSDHNGWTPLFYAAQGGHKEAFDFLFNYKSNPKLISEADKTTILHAATIGGNIKIMQFILDRVGNLSVINCKSRFFAYKPIPYLDLQDNDGFTPLMHAVSNDHIQVFKFLLREEVNPYLVNNDGANVLYLALIAPDLEFRLEIVKILLELNVNYINLKLIYDLLQKKFLSDSERYRSNLKFFIKSWLLEAAETNHIKLAELCLFLEQIIGNDFDYCHGYPSPLHHAVLWGNVQMVGMLLTRQIGVVGLDEEGNNAAHLAAIKGDKVIYRMLVEDGVNAKQLNYGGFTPDQLFNQLNKFELPGIIKQRNDASFYLLKLHYNQNYFDKPKILFWAPYAFMLQKKVETIENSFVPIVNKRNFSFYVYGEEHVGKSAYLERLRIGKFVATEPSHKIESVSKREDIYNLKVNADFRSARTIGTYDLRNVDAVFLFFSVISRPTFEEITEKWLKLIKKKCWFRDIKIFLVGTKIDLQPQRVVTYEEGLECSKRIRAKGYFECSIKTGEGLTALWDEVKKIMLNHCYDPELEKKNHWYIQNNL